MDKYYLISVIERLKSVMQEHDQKFKNNPIHNNCQSRFAKTLASLQDELAKAEAAFMPSEERSESIQSS